MSIARHRQNVSRDSRIPWSASTTAGILVRLLAVPTALTALLIFPAEADSDYKKVCKIGVNLTVLAEDANANSCRAIAVTSNSQDYQIGCRDAKNEGLVM